MIGMVIQDSIRNSKFESYPGAMNVCIGTNAKDSKKHYMKRMKV